jgi:hypothetical protein
LGPDCDIGLRSWTPGNDINVFSGSAIAPESQPSMIPRFPRGGTFIKVLFSQ